MRYLRLAAVTATALGLLAVGRADRVPSEGAKLPAARVGYVAFQRGEPSQLWVCRLDGTELRRVSAPGEKVATDVGFSRRHGLLAWRSQMDGTPGCQLRVWSVAGGAPRTIFRDRLASYSVDDAPAFTPDSRFIIFGRSTLEFGAERNEVMDWGFWQIGVAGDHLRQLTKGLRLGGGCHMASVSPDGRFIASIWWRVINYGALRVAQRTDGRSTETGLWVRDLAWSPTGSLVVSQGDWEKEPLNTRLVLYDPRTRRISRLTDYRVGHADTGARFSPGGRQVVYVSSRTSGSPGETKPSLMLVEMATRRTSTLVGDAEVSSEPVWAPDGSRICFCAETQGEHRARTDIWSVHPDGTDRRKVVEDAILANVFEE